MSLGRPARPCVAWRSTLRMPPLPAVALIGCYARVCAGWADRPGADDGGFDSCSSWRSSQKPAAHESFDVMVKFRTPRISCVYMKFTYGDFINEFVDHTDFTLRDFLTELHKFQTIYHRRML